MNLTKPSSLTLFFFLILFSNYLGSQTPNDSSSAPAVHRCAVCDTIDTLPNKSSITDPLLDLTPSASVDEQLFLVNALEYFYLLWPHSDDPAQLADSLESNRRTVSALRNLITYNRLDPNIAKLYDEYLQLTDANEGFLRNIGAINQQTIQDAQRGAAEILFDSAVTAMEGSLKHKSDREILTDMMIGAGLSIVQKGVPIASERQAAIEAEKRRLTNKIAETLDSARATARILARTHGWYPYEADFENALSDTAAARTSRRARDYFARYWLAEERSNSGAAFSNADAVKLYLEAARLAPGDRLYRRFRILAIEGAVHNALEAAYKENSGEYSNGPAPSAPFALRLSRTYLSLDPEDRTGLGSVELARALAFAGRFNEAVDAANAVLNTQSSQFGKTPGFAYRYAKLMSLTNSPDKAVEWLAYSYTLGFTDVENVRTTPDFANLRRARPERYHELTTPKVGVEVQEANYLHDIVIRNFSPFSLTNVKVTVLVRTNNGVVSSGQRECESIAPSNGCSLPNALEFWGNSYSIEKSDIRCDQGR